MAKYVSYHNRIFSVMEELPGVQKLFVLCLSVNLKTLLDIFEEKSSRQVDNVSSEEESDQEGDETGRLLRATVDELQKALEDSRSILSQRDAELNKLRNDLEQHRKQVMSLLASCRRGSYGRTILVTITFVAHVTTISASLMRGA